MLSARVISPENSFSSTTYNLPQGVTISSISYGAIGAAEAARTTVTSGDDASILFRSLEYNVSFHDKVSITPTQSPSAGNLDFFDAAGSLKNRFDSAEFVIKLSSGYVNFYININS